jgi:hypothetical protein
VARNKKNPSKKASRNVLVVAQKVSKGRGKNKHEEIKAKRGKLGTRLYCIAVSPVAKVKGGRKQAKFECFGSWEAAQVGLLARGPSAIPAPGANKDLQAMLAMQEGGVSGRRRGLRGTPREHMDRRADLVKMLKQRGLSPADRLDYETRISENEYWGLRNPEATGHGLRGTPAEHLARAKRLRADLQQYPPETEYDLGFEDGGIVENEFWGRIPGSPRR